MKVLTLWQPWASAVALGKKLVETRAYAAGSLVGERIAIHASATRRGFGVLETRPAHEVAALIGDLGEELGWEGVNRFEELPRGLIFATATVEAMLPTESSILEAILAVRPHERLWGDYAPGRWG